MENEKISIIIDHREEQVAIAPERLEAIEKSGKFDIMRDHLKVGDILLTKKNIICEIKTIEDFHGSILSSRIFEQVVNMSSNYDNRCLIIIGDFQRLFKQMKGFNQMQAGTIVHVVLGAYVSLTLKYHTPIFWVENNSQFVKILEYVNDKYGELPSVKDIVRLNYSTKDRWIAMITAIDKVGLEKAKKIAEKYPNMKSLILATEEDLKKIDGVGPKIAKSILEFVG